MRTFEHRDPSTIGNEYLVLGTVERKTWRLGQEGHLDSQELFANLHDFKEVVVYELLPRWSVNDTGME